MDRYGVRKAYDLGKLVKSKGIGFAKESLSKFASLLEELYVKVADAETQPSQIITIMDNYRLSPRDAIIALTCRHYGIDTLLTFDEDFKQISWLKVVP